MSPNHSTSQAEALALKYPSIRLEQLPSSRWIILDQPLTPFWWAHFDTEFDAYQAWDSWAESLQSAMKPRSTPGSTVDGTPRLSVYIPPSRI